MILIPENITSFLSKSWKKKYALFLHPEHWNFFLKQLEFYLNNEISDNRIPYFFEEITPPISEIIFEMKTIYQKELKTEKNSAKAWVKVFENIRFEYLLIIHGQRLTSASITDENAIPPLKSVLLNSCFEPFNKQIFIATRAWEKHVGRSNDQFWGEIKGNPTQKNAFVQKKITEMIENKSWWNIFFHYKHELVYEIRVASGHGIRWNKEGTIIIGFLEPFINDDN
ncbi:hypothetical protein [Aureivirga marina]|uniref:hypothetical protein n=1 Tax=Aureivirga marina TaxID=1182451 RepID=UPI0018CB4CB2|nr:hypothetical protein [Aureivirga marina]